MRQVTIQGKTYGYATAVRDNDAIRKSFNALTRATFGFDFAEWRLLGGWDELYQPHVLLDGETVVANISVNRQDMLLDGKPVRGVQLGAVMTAETYRRRGLSRFLMEQVLAEWAGRCDLLYLFANDGVLDFYPPFGFEATGETGHFLSLASLTSPSADTPTPRKRLDMRRETDRAWLMKKARDGNPFSEIRMRGAEKLVLFYAAGFLREEFYALPEWGLAAVLRQEPDALYVQELLGEPSGLSSPALPVILRSLTGGQGGLVRLGFPPADKTPFQHTAWREEDTTFFLLRDGKRRWEALHNPLFPVLYHT